MQAIFDGLSVFHEKYIFWLTFPKISAVDIVEMVLIAMLFYHVLLWFKSTRAWNLLRGIIVIIVCVFLAAIFQMNTILWLAEKLVNVAVIALAVIFQPELRKALEQIGRKQFLIKMFRWDISNIIQRFSDNTIHELVKATFEMSKVKTGALIVLEQDDVLSDFERTGIPIDAVVSSQLLINIFEKNTPLHDGAIIVRGDRVVSATCYLPLSDNMDLDKELGTRHRAAVGVSEASDSLTIIVSEENGAVSVARGGQIRRHLTPEELERWLKELQQVGGAEDARLGKLEKLKRRLKNAE